jgi:hypothetical protein
MTRLTIAEDSGEEFAIRGYNTLADENDDEIVFYADVTKVHVLPEPGSFTIQIITNAQARTCQTPRSICASTAIGSKISETSVSHDVLQFA